MRRSETTGARAPVWFPKVYEAAAKKSFNSNPAIVSQNKQLGPNDTFSGEVRKRQAQNQAFVAGQPAQPTGDNATS